MKSAGGSSSKRLRKPRDANATREALLRAATELFALKGYEGVRVDALARRAGVNKALINYYFGGKHNLYRAAIESSFRELVVLAEELRRPDEPPLELVRGFILGFAELAARRRPYFPSLFLRETLSTGAVAPEAVEHVGSILKAFRGVLRRGAAEGSFRRVQAAEMYLSLVGSLAFFFATGPARRKLERRNKLPLRSPTVESYVSFVQEAAARTLATRATRTGGPR
jgi:AcrR family transcriptional regulator